MGRPPCSGCCSSLSTLRSPTSDGRNQKKKLRFLSISFQSTIIDGAVCSLYTFNCFFRHTNTSHTLTRVHREFDNERLFMTARISSNQVQLSSLASRLFAALATKRFFAGFCVLKSSRHTTLALVAPFVQRDSANFQPTENQLS